MLPKEAKLFLTFSFKKKLKKTFSPGAGLKNLNMFFLLILGSTFSEAMRQVKSNIKKLDLEIGVLKQFGIT